MRIEIVDLEGAAPTECAVVIDVLRAFTTVPWLFERGVARVLAAETREGALALRDEHLPGALVAGEILGGQHAPGFDLGNSPTEVRGMDLAGRTIVHRTSAGTQGLVRTRGSARVLAASFVTAAACARELLADPPASVTFVVTGASLGRDGDEDLACAQLIVARLRGEDPDPAPYLARIATSDSGRMFQPGGQMAAHADDLPLACEVDRFEMVLAAVPADGLDAIEVRRR